jgi:8-amino-7-oxononanoate synthase
MSFETVIAAELQALRAADRWRVRRNVAVRDLANPTRVNVDGRDAINFCSNDYLGLSTHPLMREAFIAATQRFGVGAGASHLVTGHGQEHQALEEELAEFTGRSRALVFSTGYMANLSISSALLRRNDRVFSDELNHASLIDASRGNGFKVTRYAHANASELAQVLMRDAQPQSRTLVLSDGVFSMDGDIAPTKALANLCATQAAWLMIDDAHGFGTAGPGGRGSLEADGLTSAEVPIYMGTLGKALGCFGAFIAGSSELIELLINKARTYIYTTALPPAIAAAARAALKLVQVESWRREQLNANIASFTQGAAQLGLSVLKSDTAIQPVILGSEAAALQASRQLLDRGLLVAAIRPPTVPRSTSRLRITLSAAHTRDDVDQLLDALAGLHSLRDQQAVSS